MIYPWKFYDTVYHHTYLGTVREGIRKEAGFYWYQIRIITSQSQATRLFIEQFILEKNKEISKVHVTGPLWGESISDWWIPHTKG